MSDELRRALYASTAPSLDVELSPPDLVGVTEILTDEHREALCRHLPARAEGYLWTLVFSTSQHGFSLNSMYRKMQKVESPILLVIQDTDNNVSRHRFCGFFILYSQVSLFHIKLKLLLLSLLPLTPISFCRKVTIINF